MAFGNPGPSYGIGQCIPDKPPRPSAGAVCSPPPPDQVLKNIQNAIYEASGRLVNTISKVSDFGDYMLGSQAEEAGSNGATPLPSGIANTLIDAVQTLHQRITVLNEKLSRLDIL